MAMRPMTKTIPSAKYSDEIPLVVSKSAPTTAQPPTNSAALPITILTTPPDQGGRRANSVNGTGTKNG